MAVITMPSVFYPPETMTQMPALRFLMAGSVDDGKSTLTGRLLYECKAILGDQLGRLEQKADGAELDLSLLTDGLEAEREQGITIDVAYRYFSTRKRKFIIADAPGHEQYTRNMVTAAAGSDAAVVLIDVTKLDFSKRPVALLTQTRRHSLLAHLLRVPHIIFAVNKIDAVDDPRDAFEAVRESLLKFAADANMSVAAVIPLSAKDGDNVTTAGTLPWYDGPCLLEVLERVPVDGDPDFDGSFLMPVQYVSRDPMNAANSTRVLWGRIARGRVRVGDELQVFPSNERARVADVRYASDTVAEVRGGESAGVVLDRHVDITRGCWLSAPHTVQSTQQFTATIAWMDVEPAQVRRKYLIRHGTKWVQGRITSINSRLDITTLKSSPAHSLDVNEIGSVVIETQDALPVERYSHNRVAGSMIVVDPSTHHTSGALLVTALRADDLPEFVSTEARASRRVDANLPIIIQPPGSHPKFARAANLSTGGLLMSANDVLAVGSTVEVRFMALGSGSAGQEVHAHARIVDHRVDNKGLYHYHLAFFDVGSAMHELIAVTVASLSEA